MDCIQKYRQWLLPLCLVSMALWLAACSRAAPADSSPAAATSPAAADSPPAADPTPTAAGASSDAAALPTVTLQSGPTAEEAAAGESEAAEPAAENTPPAPTFDPNQVSIALEPVADGLSGPLFVTHAGDGSGRLFVVEKPGTIHILADGQVVQPAFLDLTDRVGSSGSEQGLLGLAFDPAYTETGYFWVNYTDLNGDTVIARFQTPAETPNQADPASEFVVLQLAQPARNHNGGMLLFGPDGYLWVGMGDGGAANDRFGNGQNPSTLLGKMLRLDVTSDQIGRAHV